jgi:hypothetical protein
VGVNAFGRGETGTTTDQVCIMYIMHHTTLMMQLDTWHSRQEALGCMLGPSGALICTLELILSATSFVCRPMRACRI